VVSDDAHSKSHEASRFSKGKIGNIVQTGILFSQNTVGIRRRRLGIYIKKYMKLRRVTNLEIN
jgi:hypothetical protein